MYRIGPIGRKSNFHSREKCLIGLVLVTLCFLCFGGIFLLPDNFGSDRVLRVYKHFQKAGPEIFIPAPPLAAHASRDEDPHFMGDRQRLQQKIKEELGEMLDEPQQAVAQAPVPAPAVKPAAAAPAAQQEQPAGLEPEDDGEDLPEEAEQQQKAAMPMIAAPLEGGGGAVSGSTGGVANNTPRLQLPMGGGGHQPADARLEEKREKLKEMMQHAWHNYKLYAWGKNELRPLSQRPHTGSIFGSYDLGATIVDGLDTLYIMGLEQEYKEGRDWIERKFSLDNISAELSVFETNIRFVGGMLTLYAFTGDPLYKDKAQHVADKLLPAFQSPTGIPYALVNTRTGIAKNYGWASGGSSILSEFGTLHLEFSYLSDITGNPLYRERVQTIRQVLQEIEKPKGLYPNFLNPKTGKWGQLHMSLGALGDSFYEYLLKAWLQSGQTDEEAREMYDEAMTTIMDKMVRKSTNGLIYVSDLKFDRLEHKMDHLACFSGGLFALGAATRQNEHADKYMEVGKGITNTCHESYIRAPTKLGPEAFRFSDAAEARALRSQEKYYILRPETFESYFVLWRLTHDQKYRDWGWEAVQALEKHCRTAHGYCGLRNVYQAEPVKDDVQQSFFLAETLKYLYLLFSDDSVLPLDEWVFNTEAHPLPIKGANIYYRQAPATQPAPNAS
ncbi:mannosyl-oligosaccharide alpha-1,2-mannosidase IA isoform X2 [Scaptodrosophila lebanonensis]|uniref:alpha-1,2-Mannosidase n=1 Tax=Drosophila lebanonensis TaxID=7225 RepID=A0A6J2TZU6_DROLE|nr:mannosyl-oligosaccharide alpha-1,2-mannosidase IA isoform X2 [Scaptodrosophila lebanonensis]XP_030381623.1 mannosyl-oligosaccharide alpha-1,2-mannosidase IA isoform X2 [Scaptodrosophila lebanonensis]XP_030381624.1 mannosyl-oligosaccharide alpha-1,2-mannosidase IA isoform X2 [Scaptodrosophila lebanonensis]XP_030381625.1 mannosyl-oligosaccharide alpha-1,2-mannosidase IA isoform X2 [Scaptodrosophila lebanonensis]